ncbi:hypothetical protein [Streptomyces sp. NPDC005423]|uniref:hypothetical protein n=1 Tax=Streptomyces sp. NPDC005423 TaxID=3155343 RepID=UPI0033B0AB18
MLDAAGERQNLATVLRELDVTGAVFKRVTTFDNDPADPAATPTPVRCVLRST